MSFTVRDLDNAVKELDKYECYDGWEDLIEELQKGTRVVFAGVGELHLVEEKDAPYGEGGRDGEMYAIVSVGDRYFKRQGYYASFEGGGLDGPTIEVKPGEVKVRTWYAV